MRHDATSYQRGDDQAVLDAADVQRRLAAGGPAQRAEILGETVRAVASAVLDEPAFGSGSSFLESGLTSLRALELYQKLTELTGIEVPLVALIEHPTPEDLGQFMAELPAGH